MNDEQVDRVISDEVLRERIRKLQAQGEPEGSLARTVRHPLTILLLGFLLTTAAGQSIVYYYQERAAANQATQTILEARRDAGTQTLSDVGRLMDRRLFWGGEFWHAVKTGAPDSTRNRMRAQFDSTVWAWRESYNTNAAIICRIFGPESSKKFGGVTTTFSNFGNDVRRADVDSVFRRQQHDSLDSLYDSARVSALDFDLHMVDLIRTGKIGEQAAQSCAVIAPNDTTFRLQPRRR